MKTFTKKWVSIILWASLFFMFLSYILAFLDKTQIAESLSEQVCVVIVGTIIPYLCKSFFETYCEKKNEINNKNADIYTDIDDNINIDVDTKEQTEEYKQDENIQEGE